MSTETLDKPLEPRTFCTVPIGGRLASDDASFDSPAVEPRAAPWSLGAIFRSYRWRILLTYGLFNLENLLLLLQPIALGLAINDLLAGTSGGLILFVGLYLAHLVIGTVRRMYDTRAFTGIYTDLASRLVVDQRRRDIEVSRVAARSALSRDYVDFFERDVPLVVQALYALVGALVMLALFDGRLILFCLVLLVPAWALNRRYGRKAYALNGELHDGFEREVEVVGRGRPAEVRQHYTNLARSRVRLSDLEAVNFGLMELFVLGLLVVALLRSCATPGAAPGDLFAVFRYLLMFVTGLDRVPIVVQQLGRLRDIGRRMNA